MGSQERTADTGTQESQPSSKESKSLLPARSDRCKKCGLRWGRLALLAMFMDAGAQTAPNPLDCDHEFENSGDASQEGAS